MNPVILAFTAHPDDAEIAMGGTLAALAEAGYSVHTVTASIPDYREHRTAEIAAGAQILGTVPHLLEHEGTWQVEDLPTYRLVAAFDQYITELQPVKVFTHWTGDTHLDHARVAAAVIAAMRHSTADLYLAEQANQYAPAAAAFKPDTYVDISGQLERKLKAVACHTSQSAESKFGEHLRARARFHGDRIGCEAAEVFTCLFQRLRPI